jgi:hypothetical protein
MKFSRSFDVVTCSGITDPDLPSLDKCPFYAEDYNICAITGWNIEDATNVPDSCYLRTFNIEVSTGVLNQTEMALEGVDKNV